MEYNQRFISQTNDTHSPDMITDNTPHICERAQARDIVINMEEREH